MSVASQNRVRTSVLAAALVQIFSAAMAIAHAEEAAADKIVRLDRLTVIGSREKADEANGSAHYLDAKTLEEFNYRDIHRVLRQVPGVYLVDEDGYGLRPNIGIRGSGTDRSARITLMEDGVLIAPAPYAAPAAYHFPSMARINAVEVRKGSAAVKTGPRTTGGAINLITTPIPNTYSGLVDLAAGSDGVVQAHAWAGFTDGRIGGLIEGVRQHADGFKHVDGGGDSGYDLDDYVAKLRLTSDADAVHYQSLTLEAGRSTQDSNETYAGLSNADFARDPYRRYAGSQRDHFVATHYEAVARHFIELSSTLDLTTVAYRNDYDRAWYKLEQVGAANRPGGRVNLAPLLADTAKYAQEYAWLTGATDSPDDALAVRNNARSYYAQGVQSVLGWHHEGDVEHDLEVGLRWHQDAEDRFQNEDFYAMRGGHMVLTRNGPLGGVDNRISEAEALSAYVQDEIRWGDWIFTPGVRYERIDLTRTDFRKRPDGRALGPSKIIESRVTEVTPGLGTTYRVNDDLNVFASVYRGFNPPAPGSDADPEESVNSEIGVRYGHEALSASLIGFSNDYGNLVGTCTISSSGCDLGSQFDGGKARIRGVEAMFGYNFNPDGGWQLPLDVSYTFTDARFRNTFASEFEEWGRVQSGDRLPYLPEHTLHVGFGVIGEHLRVNLSGNYVDDMRIVAGQGTPPADLRTESAVVWDTAASWSFQPRTQAKHLELYARIENLTDRAYIAAYRPAGARPAAPRTGVVGLRWMF